MTISLVEVAGANFRTDHDSDKLNDEFMIRLGMRKRYLPARLAIARSLSMRDPLAISKESPEAGRIIKGDTLFGTGTELTVWLSLIVESAGKQDIDAKGLVALVSAHWGRGLARLDKEWEQAGDDVSKFVRKLVEVAGLPLTGGKPNLTGADDGTDHVFPSDEIRIPMGEVGEDVTTDETVFWSMNDKGGSPHCAIMGGSGSGKTVMASAMLRSIREQARVPLLAFDFKGDLADFTGTKKEKSLGETYHAQVSEPPRMPIPLDVLSVSQ